MQHEAEIGMLSMLALERGIDGAVSTAAHDAPQSDRARRRCERSLDVNQGISVTRINATTRQGPKIWIAVAYRVESMEE